MITLQCRLGYKSEKDRQQVLALMRRWSACERYAYQRLLEGKSRKELKRNLPFLFGLNTRYADDAILKAQEILSARQELGLNPRKVIFGGRRLFKQLQGKHINGSKRVKLMRRWRELRQGNLYSRGDASKQGNLNLRFVWQEGGLYLRINVGPKKYVYAKVHRKVQPGRSLKDKWTVFTQDLIQARLSRKWFPYTVELKAKEGKVYALVSFKERLPEIKITRDFGVIGLDINASPFHLAWVEVKEDGNPVDSGRVNLSHLIGEPASRKDLLIWQTAHKVVELAKERSRAIAIEDLRKMPKGRRGDGRPRLRRRFQQFIYRKLLERIAVLACRNGIEVRKVPAEWSSVIGALKYGPEYGLDKDRAAALVIGRRGLGMGDKLPRSYKAILLDRPFLDRSVSRWQKWLKALYERLKSESNPWKKNRIQAEIRQATIEIERLKRHIKALSPGSGPVFPRRTARGKKSSWGRMKVLQWGWSVLRAATVVPLLGKPFVRDFSPLRLILVSGAGKRAAEWLAGVPGASAMGVSNTASWGWDTLKGGEQIPQPQTTIVRFG